MKLPHKTLERKLFNSGYKYIAAVDEAGVGPLAGPVVASAVLIPRKVFEKRDKNLYWLRDSKKVAEESNRFRYIHALMNHSDFIYSTGYASSQTVDKINIYQATQLAMRRALKKLPFVPDIVLVDGNRRIKEISIEQQTIVKGDEKVFSIACASLIAKVTRDKIMVNFGEKYPQYQFEKHKGYSTKLHKKLLKIHGPCEIHRKSFAPVAELL